MDSRQFVVKREKKMTSSLEKQVGGDHYKKMKIQPIEFIVANNLTYPEGCIVKYICRWKDKNGIEDLEKIIHYVEIMIEEEKNKVKTPHIRFYCRKCKYVFMTNDPFQASQCPKCLSLEVKLV